MRVNKNRMLVLLAVGLLGGLIAACSPATSTEQPTQTPLYVVVTDTPQASAVSTSMPSATPSPAVTPTATTASNTVELPAAFICNAYIVEQTFENGFMFWVGATTEERCKEEHTFDIGTGEIWVVIFDSSGRLGEWLTYDDTWDAATEPETDPTFVPPSTDLSQPIRGFGKVWREQLTAAEREALGWATAHEVGFVTQYRYDAGGFLNDQGDFVERPGIDRLVTTSGETVFFDETDQTAFYLGNSVGPVSLEGVTPTPEGTLTPTATPTATPTSSDGG